MIVTPGTIDDDPATSPRRYRHVPVDGLMTAPRAELMALLSDQALLQVIIENQALLFDAWIAALGEATDEFSKRRDVIPGAPGDQPVQYRRTGGG